MKKIKIIHSKNESLCPITREPCIKKTNDILSVDDVIKCAEKRSKFTQSLYCHGKLIGEIV